jgi:hypothetical protein
MHHVHSSIMNGIPIGKSTNRVLTMAYSATCSPNYRNAGHSPHKLCGSSHSLKKAICIVNIDGVSSHSILYPLAFDHLSRPNLVLVLPGIKRGKLSVWFDDFPTKNFI